MTYNKENEVDKMEEKLHIISSNLKRLRNKSGLSEKEIAKLLNISLENFKEYENNPKDLSMEFLEKIAVILHCNIADFFIESNDTNSDNKG